MPSERSHAFIRRHRVHLMDLDSDYRCITTRADRNKVREEFPELTKPAIIAVLGLPHTGRESICEMLGVCLRSPVYNIQAPLDALWPHQGYVDDDEAARRHRLCFDVVCQMAEYYLSGENYGVNCAIVSSTFFDYTWQLGRLFGVVSQGKARWRTPRLVVVECRRKNKFQWQLSVDKEEEVGNNRYWYQPKCWKDVDKSFQELTQQQGGDHDDNYFLVLARSNPNCVIKNLVVDPFEDISHNISELGGNGYSSLFARAIKNLLTCSENEEHQIQIPSVVYYDQWRRRQLEEAAARVTAHHYCCRPGDCIFKFTHNTETSEAETCDICEESIARGGYYCKFCSLSFHESCATKTAALEMSLPQVIMKMTHKESHHYHACYSCIDKGKEFSSFCNSCLFRTFIVKSRLLPVIFNHSVGDDHPLSLRLIDGNYPYLCTACGLGGKLASYGCHICKAQYHLECLRAPLQTKNRHGGHLHTIDVQLSRAVEGDEYEWCLVCYQDIDPKTWAYSCRDCDYIAHLYCIFPTIFKESQH